VPDSKPPPSVAVGLRVDDALLARLDALAAQLSRPGAEVTRSDALRLLIGKGLDAIERGTKGEEPLEARAHRA
jgi:predicted transcriptional regulator